MKCKECSKDIEEPLKDLAYYSNGKPVYWKKCEDCLKKIWQKVSIKRKKIDIPKGYVDNS